MKKNEKEPALVDQSRQAVRDSGLSLNELARRTKVSQPQLSRFMRDERTLTLPAAARLCEVLGLTLVKGASSSEADRQPGGTQKRSGAKTK
jgi:transcriptional regulator with XRE-family HTH domain